MKIYSLLIVFLIFASCKKESTKENQTEQPKVASLENGQVIFQDNNCAACHQMDQKIVGPSLQDIAKIYKEKNGNLVSFLKEEAAPIVDKEQYQTMKINLQMTKNMSEEELKSLEIYILSQAK